MATDPNDPDRSGANKASSQSQNPQEQTPRREPLITAGLVASQADAMDRFRRNSERMQANAELKRDDLAKTQGSKGDRPDASQDRCATEPSSRDAGDNREPAQEQSDRKLQFAKDHERGARLDLKTETAKQHGKELSFVKDQSQDLNRGR